MINPAKTLSVLPAGEERPATVVPLVRARGFSVTCRATFGAGNTGNVVANLYYSPDGVNFDTSPYASLTVPVTASESVQASAYVVVPEHGYIKITVSNEDASNDVNNVLVWFSIQSYADGEVYSKGNIDKETA